MKNQMVAETLYTIANLLDIKGENFFKIRAYRIAAQTIEGLDENIEKIAEEKRLTNIPGVGEALAKKILELLTTGNIRYLEKLKKEIPEGLLELLEIPGLGPKKVAALYTKLGITTIADLKKACEHGTLRHLEGFGEITERNILRGISLREQTTGRVLLNVAYVDGMEYLDYLKRNTKIDAVSLAGSVRRMKETIGDLDILVSSKHPEQIMEYFIQFPRVKKVLMKGVTKTSVQLDDLLQVDIRVVPDKSYGAALQYFTGSKEHNVAVRSLASRKGYKLSEYGLFTKKNQKYVAGKNEQDIYQKLELSYIEPELRENRGEVDAAKKHQLPVLVRYDDMQGDFHVHSRWSDGFDDLTTLAQYAQTKGYQFLGSTDHSQSLKIANGLSEEKLKKKLSEIRKLNETFSDFMILYGTECDILPDGTLDYSKKILSEFDFVYIGIHSRFKMTKKEMTQRIISGMETGFADFLAHPTGRMIGKREPFEVDVEKIFDTAKRTDMFLEINAFPDRLDLNDVHIKQAREYGIRFVIGTDAHAVNHLDFMQFGVAQARRGWLEKKDILNAYSFKKIKKILEIP
ncbi:MAG: DNA polymerase/3'-5' exonuclease PolX [Candidatus Thermoplasmatota archaeon]